MMEAKNADVGGGGVNVPYPMVGWGDAAGDRIRALRYSYSR